LVSITVIHFLIASVKEPGLIDQAPEALLAQLTTFTNQLLDFIFKAWVKLITLKVELGHLVVVLSWA
jgi:hypothetical protein